VSSLALSHIYQRYVDHRSFIYRGKSREHIEWWSRLCRKNWSQILRLLQNCHPFVNSGAALQFWRTPPNTGAPFQSWHHSNFGAPPILARLFNSAPFSNSGERTRIRRAPLQPSTVGLRFPLARPLTTSWVKLQAWRYALCGWSAFLVLFGQSDRGRLSRHLSFPRKHSIIPEIQRTGIERGRGHDQCVLGNAGQCHNLF